MIIVLSKVELDRLFQGFEKGVNVVGPSQSTPDRLVKIGQGKTGCRAPVDARMGLWYLGELGSQ